MKNENVNNDMYTRIIDKLKKIANGDLGKDHAWNVLALLEELRKNGEV